jgi:hypothetical protein
MRGSGYVKSAAIRTRLGVIAYRVVRRARALGTPLALLEETGAEEREPEEDDDRPGAYGGSVAEERTDHVGGEDGRDHSERA